MKDYKFLKGLTLYLILIHYSIFVGYVYGSYKNYNIVDSLIISSIVGILAPFFLPIHYILNNHYKNESFNTSIIVQGNNCVLINLKYLCIKYNKINPLRIRV